jgi:hypothetical protein
MNYYNYPTPLAPQPGQYIVQPSAPPLELNNYHNPFYQRPQLITPNLSSNQPNTIIVTHHITPQQTPIKNTKKNMKTKNPYDCFPCCLL